MRALVSYFARRHFLVHVLTAVVVALGVSAATSSQREGFPAITLNQLIVTAKLPGAAAADVETKVTLPLEEGIADVDGVEEISSVITDNRSVTTVKVYEHYGPTQIREVQADLRQAIDAIGDFPPELDDTPSIQRVEAAKIPVIEVALSGPSEALVGVAQDLERRLERVDGVARATVLGLADPELRVLVDPEAARAHSVGLTDLVGAIEQRNISGTGGIVESSSERRQVVVDARFSDPREVEDLVLRADAEGGLLRLGSVARAELGREDRDLIVHTNGRPGMSIVVRKRVEADILATVDRVREALDEVILPPGVAYTLVNDQSFVTRNRLALMTSNGLLGITLVIVVLGLFLTRRAALWVSFGVPVVLLGVIALLPIAGLTLNLITLAGLVMVLGMLVDDAVVVAERIVHAQQDQPAGADAGANGEAPEVKGAMSVIRPVFASALTTALAFTPMLSLGGMPGKVAWALPVVVVLALAVSLVESFLVLPAHMATGGEAAPESRRVPGAVASAPTPATQLASRPARARVAPEKRPFMLALERAYGALLRRVLRLRYLVVLAFVAVFGFVMGVIRPQMGFDLFPQNDSDALHIKVTTPLGTPIERTEAAVLALEEQLPRILGDDLLAVTARVGHQDPHNVDLDRGSAENEAVINALFKPLDRAHTSAEWAEILERELRVPAEARVGFEARRIGPPLGRPVTVHVASNDDSARRSTAHKVAAWLAATDGLSDIEVDERPGIRQIELNPDHDKLALRGLDARSVSTTLKAAFHGIPVSEHRSLDATTSFRVIFDPSARADMSALLETSVRSRAGELVPLRDVVSPVDVASVARIYHREGLRTATVTASFAPGAGLDAGGMAKRIDAELLPALDAEGVHVYQGGEAKEAAKTTADLGRAALLAVFGIVVVIALVLGSFLDAFFVVSVIPFGAAGVLLAFFAHGYPLSLFAMLGTLGLTGVVVNASIVMIDAVKVRQRQVEEAAAERRDATAERRDAMIDAVVGRLRPILVTTLTTVGGVLPTAYGLGGYDAVLSPMSLALGWGLVFATGITLLLVPSLFAIAEDLRGIRSWRSWRPWQPASARSAPVPPAPPVRP